MKKTSNKPNDSVQSSIEALLARTDVLSIAVKTIIKHSSETEHLANEIYRQLMQTKDAMLFSSQASEPYRTSFEIVLEDFAPARLLRRETP